MSEELRRLKEAKRASENAYTETMGIIQGARLRKLSEIDNAMLKLLEFEIKCVKGFHRLHNDP